MGGVVEWDFVRWATCFRPLPITKSDNVRWAGQGAYRILVEVPPRELSGRDTVLIRMGDSADAIARKVISAMRKRPELIYRKEVMSNYSWGVVFQKHIVPAVVKPDTVWKR